MRFKKEYKPDECASTDVTRSHLFGVHLDKKAQRLVATDGHIIVTVPCEAEAGDVDGLLPVEAIRGARRTKQPYGQKDQRPKLRPGKKLIDDGTVLHRRANHGRFPEWKSAFPAWKPGDKGTVTFGLNPILLTRLAKAMAADRFIGITVKLPEDGKEMLDPIIVFKEYAEEGVAGVCMPARITVPK